MCTAPTTQALASPFMAGAPTDAVTVLSVVEPAVRETATVVSAETPAAPDPGPPQYWLTPRAQTRRV